MFALRFFLLFLTWCAFSGLFDPFHLTLGAVSCLWIASVTNEIFLSQTEIARPRRRLSRFFGLVGYGGWLLVEVIKANVQVFLLAFSSPLEEKLSPALVEFRTALADDFSRFLLAHSITLTPGTVTVRVDGDHFAVHALTEEMAAGVPGEMEARLLRLFGGQEEVEDGNA